MEKRLTCVQTSKRNCDGEEVDSRRQSDSCERDSQTDATFPANLTFLRQQDLNHLLDNRGRGNTDEGPRRTRK